MRGIESRLKSDFGRVPCTALILMILVLSTVYPLASADLPASAANPAPPLAPSRLTRPGAVSNSASANNGTLTGSVSQTTLNSSRLTRVTAPGSAAPPVSSVSPASNASSGGSLFSQTDKDAFSTFSAPPPVYVPPVTQASTSYSSSGGINGGVNQSASSTKSSSGSGDLLRKGAGLYSQLQQQFKQSPMLRAEASSLLKGLAGYNRGTSLSGSANSGLAGSAVNAINRSVSKLPYVGRTLNKQELTLLSNYEVAVIIDKSGSMDERDCPGNLTRWDWCASQLSNLASQTSAVFRNGITVALFSSDYQVYRNADLSMVSNIFARNSPSGGTYMAKPMSEVLDEYFDRRDHSPSSVRKLLIEVISDGEPSDRGELIATIARATRKMNRPDEVRINFIQIGNERDGGALLNKLDNRLSPDEGAQFDIVSVSPFSSVASQGLPGAMADAARH